MAIILAVKLQLETTVRQLFEERDEQTAGDWWQLCMWGFDHIKEDIMLYD
jgi:hypothetical protein